MVANISSDIKASGPITRILNFLYQYSVFLPLASVFIYINFRMYIPGITNTPVGVKKSWLLLAVIITILELCLLYKYLLSKISVIANIIISIFMMALLFGFIILTLLNFRVTPSWDFGDVLNGAYDIANKRPFGYGTYFEIYPHNLNPAIFIGLFIRLLGTGYWSPYIMNTIFIMISVIISYILARKILGSKLSTLVPIIFIFTTPIYLYSPIVYTDTLSLPFPVLSVLLWVMARDKKANTLTKYYSFFALIGLSSAIGYLFKPLAAVGLIAAIIEAILFNKYFEKEKSRAKLSFIFTRKVIPVLVALFIFGGTIGAFNFYKSISGYSYGIPSEKTFPLSHWFMLGTNKPFSEGGTSYGYGGFSHEDMFFTKALPSEELKKSETMRVFKQRILDMGPNGYVKFLLKKIEYTWDDGTFYVLIKLGRFPLKDEPNFIMGGTGVSNKPYIIEAQLTHAVILLLMLILFIGSLFIRTKSICRMPSSMCLGVMIFLLFWETRSRYLVTLIPLFNILAVCGIDFLTSLFDKQQSQKQLEND